MHGLPVQGLLLAQQNSKFPLEADGCGGRRICLTLGTESICWKKGPGWDHNPSSTTQLAPSVEAGRGLIGYSLDVTDRIPCLPYPRVAHSCLPYPRVSSRLVEPPAPRESSAEAKCQVGQWFKIIIKHLRMDKYNEVSPLHKQVWDFKGVYRLPGTLWSQQGQNLGCWIKCSGFWSPSRVRDNRASWKSVVDERGRNKAAWCPRIS